MGTPQFTLVLQVTPMMFRYMHSPKASSWPHPSNRTPECHVEHIMLCGMQKYIHNHPERAVLTPSPTIRIGEPDQAMRFLEHEKK